MKTNNTITDNIKHGHASGGFLDKIIWNSVALKRVSNKNKVQQTNSHTDTTWTSRE
jgi:hypothetical protein